MAWNGHTALSEHLSELKQQGSSFLVIGTVPSEKHASVSRQLLGDSLSGPRHRIIVVTDDRLADVTDRLPERSTVPDSSSTRVIRVTESERSAAAQDTDAVSASSVRYVDPSRIDKVGLTILEMIRELNRAVPTLAPAELRFCFDSLTPLIQRHDDKAVFKFVHILNYFLRDHRAMAHFHFPSEPNSQRAHLLSPLVDGTIELNTTNSHVQQRWHLHDPDIVTEWLDI